MYSGFGAGLSVRGLVVVKYSMVVVGSVLRAVVVEGVLIVDDVGIVVVVKVVAADVVVVTDVVVETGNVVVRAVIVVVSVEEDVCAIMSRKYRTVLK